MPPSPAVADRDCRILAGHAAGATVIELALAEEVATATVRRVLVSAGITPRFVRDVVPDHVADCLADPAWLRSEYETKSAGRIAKELGCPRDRVYEVLHAAGIPVRTNGYYPKPPGQISPEVAERAVSLYLAGSSIKAVAGELGLKVQHVSRLVEERGVKRSRSDVARLAASGPSASPPGGWPAVRAAEVLERDAAGESGVRIAESLGLAQSSVYGVLEECTLSSSSGVLRSHAEASCLREGLQKRSEAVGEVQAGLPAELVEQAVARYLAGDSPRIIGRALGAAPTRVYLTLRERGVVRTRSEASKLGKARARAKGLGQATELPAGCEAAVVERYVAGESGRAIANDLGVSRPRVYGVLRARGLIRPATEARKLDEARCRAAKAAAKGQEAGPAAPAGAKRKGWTWPAEVAELVVERYRAGESGETIAADLGVGQSRVYVLLRERGVLRTLSQASPLREERRRRAS